MQRPAVSIWMVSLWQTTLDMNLWMRQKWSFLMRMATLCRRKQIKYCLSVLQKQSVRSFRDFTAPKRMEPSKHFHVEVLISQDLSFRGQCGQPVMRTGPMSPDFWSQIQGSSTIQSRSRRSLTVNSASSPTWEPAYCMRMRYSLCAKLVYRSISVIRMHRKMREPGSWRAPAISQNIRSPVSQVKKVSFL